MAVHLDPQEFKQLSELVGAYDDVLSTALMELLRRGDTFRFISFLNSINEGTTYLDMWVSTGNGYTVPIFPASMNWKKQLSEYMYFLKRYLTELYFLGIPRDTIGTILEFEIDKALNYL